MTTKENHLAQIHNDTAEAIMKLLIRPTLEAGGKPEDVLVILESVVAATIMILTIDSGEADFDVATALFLSILTRLPEIRAKKATLDVLRRAAHAAKAEQTS